MKRGLLIVVSGPSGVGKGTVRKEVFKDKSLNLAYSISMTTRTPRNGEKDGVDYFFVTTEDFENKIRDNYFLEHTKFVGNYYGTPKSYVEHLRDEGKNVFLEIEINGAKEVLSKYLTEDVVSIFLVPPSLEELEARIRGRKSESEEIIKERLEKAQKEITYQGNYRYTVVNDSVDKAAEAIKKIIRDNIKSY